MLDQVTGLIEELFKQVSGTVTVKSAMSVLFGIVALITVIETAKVVLRQYNNKRLREKAILIKITPQNTADILVTEQFLMYLHGLLINTKWRVWTEGQPYLSYEIVGRHKAIEFYMWIPRRYKKVIEEQIYVCYPDCIVEEVKDHMLKLSELKEQERISKKGETEESIKREKIQIHGMEVRLGLSYIFPIADKIDIMNSILASITGLEKHEKIVLQMIVKPLDRSWQNRGRALYKTYEKKGIHPNSNKFAGLSDELTDLKSQLYDELLLTYSPLKQKKANDTTRADREEMKEAAKKVLKSGFEVQIRILGTGYYGRGILDKVRSVASAFNKVDYINRTKKSPVYFREQFYTNVQERKISFIQRDNILTPGEMAGFILRMPDKKLNISEVTRNKLIQLPPPLMEFEKKKNIIGNIIYKGQEIPFGLRPQDARRHIHMIGGIGVGKSVELENMFVAAALEGRGAILLEPHGELSDNILNTLVQKLPEKRLEDILFYDFSDSEWPIPFNFMKIYFDQLSRMSRSDMVDETAEEFMNIMKQIFSDSWGIRTEKIFRHTGKALMEADQGGLWNAKQMLKDRKYRKKVIKSIKNVAVKDFWETEFVEKKQANGTYKLDSEMRNAIDSPLTKLDRFLSSERILNMVAQDDCINFKECINGNKIVIFKIPKGVLKEENTKFLGNIVFSKLMMAFMARNPEEMKQDTLVMADEVQNFVTTNPKSFEMLLDELRKFGVQFVMAHQRVSQIEPIISAVMDNVGSTVCFRVGVESSRYMQKVYDKFLVASDLEQLENRYAYCRALVNGQKTDPFLIKTLDRFELDPEKSKEKVQKVIDLNRANRKPKEEVEKELKEKIKVDPESENTDFKDELDDDYINNRANVIRIETRYEQTEKSGMPSLPKEWQ